MSHKAIALLVEDNPADARLIREMLRDAGDPLFELEVAESLQAGLTRLARGDIAVVLLDLDLPDSQGIDTFMRAHAQASDVPVVLLSGLNDEAMAMRIMESGAQDYLIKGEVTGALLMRTMRYAIERKRNEVELRRAWQYARSLLEASLDPLVTISPQGKITDVNKATEEATGVPRERLIGSDFSDYFTEPEKAREGYQRVIAEGLVRDYPLTMRHVSGRTMDVLYNATVYRNEAGELQGVFAAARDVTERLRAERALQQANIELEQRVAARTAALRASNESLSKEVAERRRVEECLKALNETLEQRIAERTAIAEQRAAQLRVLASELTQAEQRERRRLAQILHDDLQQLLAAAKLQVGVAQYRSKKAGYDSLQRVHELLDQSIQISRSLTLELSPPVIDLGLVAALHWLEGWMQEKHGLTVEIVADERVHVASADVRMFLFQAVRELLFNVVKHAGVCHATVELSQTPDQQVQIVVADQGIGFDPNQRQPDKTLSGGFGLFSIEERIGALGGRVEIDSAPGVGTRITLYVPLSKTAQATATSSSPNREPASGASGVSAPTLPKSPVVRGGKIRVLLADDRQTMREEIARLLRDQPDIEVVGEAGDGQAVIELTRQLQPDVVVMDVSMPGLDGIAATRRIVAEFSHVRVIGLSIHTEDDTALAMREAGAVAYLTKDSPSNLLVNTIYTSLRPAS